MKQLAAAALVFLVVAGCSKSDPSADEFIIGPRPTSIPDPTPASAGESDQLELPILVTDEDLEDINVAAAPAESDSAVAELHLAAARLAMASDDTPAALESWRTAADTAPGSPFIQSQVGRALAFDIGDPGAALEHLEAATRLVESPSAFHLHNYALALRDLGDFHEALPVFDEAVALDPENSLLLANRAVALIGLGSTDAALDDLCAAIELGGYGLSTAQYRLDDLLTELGRLDEADLICSERVAGAGS